MAHADEIWLDDGTRISVGDRAKHRKHGYSGPITKIVLPERGASAVWIRIEPDAEDFDRCMRKAVSWTLEGGKRYLEPRDSGLPLSQWEFL